MLLRGFVVGAAVATGALMLLPGVAKATARAARPILRTAMKSGAVAAKEFSQAAAEAYEHFEDLAAEVSAELDQEHADADTETPKPETVDTSDDAA